MGAAHARRSHTGGYRVQKCMGRAPAARQLEDERSKEGKETAQLQEPEPPTLTRADTRYDNFK